MMEIDAVIPWVDGNDPVLQSKHVEFGDAASLKFSDVGGSTRFASIGEIFWCVASINRNMPFIRKIWIVTDGQDPKLGDFLARNFPEGSIPVEIVDHKEIFRGYEQYLPVFNSTSIETMLWRIPGLSEHFILLNDDFVVVSPVTPEDFFPDEGKVICYGDRFSIRWEKFLYMMKPKKQGHKPNSFKARMVNAADIAGSKGAFYYLRHTPRALLKSFYEDFFASHEDVLVRNIRHRFRHSEQFQNQELEYLVLKQLGRCVCVPPAKVAFYVEPKRGDGYFDAKLDILKKGNYKFCCFNSIDQATPEEQAHAVAWVKDTLGIDF